MGFPGIPGSNGLPGMPGVPGLKDPTERTVLRDKLVIKDHKECRVQEEREGAKGLLERVDQEESKG